MIKQAMIIGFPMLSSITAFADLDLYSDPLDGVKVYPILIETSFISYGILAVLLFVLYLMIRVVSPYFNERDRSIRRNNDIINNVESPDEPKGDWLGTYRTE